MVFTISVLYVDDDSSLLEIGKLYLERTNEFAVSTAPSASVALERLQSSGIQTIVSDYQMPEMDGIEFLKQVRMADKTIPFILFTGKGREEIAIEAFENGADSYIQKGGDPKPQFAELTQKIRSAVEHRRADAQVVAVNRLYAVLSATNKAIVLINDKTELLNEICRIAVEIGGFTMAWAGIANARTDILELVASSGHSDHYLDDISLLIEGTPPERSPTGTAFHDGKFTVCNDIGGEPATASWRNGALEQGYWSLAAFPFGLNTGNSGVITFYASEPGFFNEPIIQLLDEQSKDISFALLNQDHEEQRIAAEHDLKKSELRYRRLFETAPDGILILDGDTGLIIDANTFVQEMLGYPLEYFVGRHLWELGFLRDKSFAQNAFMKLKADGYIRYENLPLETSQGNVMEAEFISNLYYVGDKKIFQCNIRDITRMKEAYDILRESETRYRRLFETAQDGILILDGDTGQIIDANSFILDLLGYPLEYFVGRQLWELGFLRDKSFALNAFTKLKTEGYIRYENLPLETKQGCIMDVEFISNGYLAGNKQVIQCNIRNVTDRKRTENALALASRKLNLMSGITRHDIVNQLLTLNGFLELLHEKVPDPALERYFTRIAEASNRISTMIHFTREYEQIGVTAPAWQDIATLVGEAAKQAPLGKIIVTNDIPAGSCMFADPMIVKVFYNLMENAVRYGGKITTIRFSVKKTSGNSVVLCEDDGDGIPAEDKNRIFNRGFGKNSGLGLFLSREILSITGISISETGIPGKGARFEITVPEGAFRIKKIPGPDRTCR